MECSVIAHCTWLCRGVMPHICCSCILLPIFLPFFPAPSHWANCSFLTRGLEGWKALQIACTVHIQAAYLIFWQSFSNPAFSTAYKSVCPWFCTAFLCSSVTPDDLKVFCGNMPHLFCYEGALRILYRRRSKSLLGEAILDGNKLLRKLRAGLLS